MADIQTDPSQDETTVTVTTQPGDELPTLGYPTGGGDFTIKYNADGTYTNTIKIISGASGGPVTGYTGTGSVTVTTTPTAPLPPVDPVTIPYPPSVYSNEYQEWEDTYFNTLEIPEESEPWYIEGYLRDQYGNPLLGTVIARNRETHVAYDIARSDPVTGFYKVDVPTLVEMYIYVILDTGQAVIYDRYICKADKTWDLDYLELTGNHDRLIYDMDGETYSDFALSYTGHKLFGLSVSSTDYGFVRIVEWDLPEAFEIRERVLVGSKTFNLPIGQTPSAGRAFCFNNTGTVMLLASVTEHRIRMFSLSSAWNVGSMSNTGAASPYSSFIDGTSLDITSNGLWIQNGTAQFELTSPWNLATLTINDTTAGPTATVHRWHNNGQLCMVWAPGGWIGYDDFTTPYDWTTQIGGLDRDGNDLFNGDQYLAFASHDGRVVYASQEYEDTIYSDHPYSINERYMRADLYDVEWPQTLRPAHKHIGYQWKMSEDIDETYPTVSLFSPDGRKLSFLDGYYRAHYYELGTPWNIGTAIHKASVDEAYNPWRDFSINGYGIPFYQIFDICANPDGKTIYIVENYESIREIYLSRPFDFTSLVRGTFGATDPNFDAEWNCNNRVIWFAPDDWYDGTPESDIKAPPGHEGSFYGVSAQGACFHPSGMWIYILDYTNGYVWQVPLWEPFKVHQGCMTEKYAAGPILTSPWNENFEGDWDVGSLQISTDGTRMFSGIRDNPYRDPVERGNFSYHVLDTPFDIRTLRTIKQITFPSLNGNWNPDTFQYHADGKSVYANDYYVGMVQSDVVNKYGG